MFLVLDHTVALAPRFEDPVALRVDALHDMLGVTGLLDDFAIVVTPSTGHQSALCNFQALMDEVDRDEELVAVLTPLLREQLEFAFLDETEIADFCDICGSGRAEVCCAREECFLGWCLACDARRESHRRSSCHFCLKPLMEEPCSV